MVYETPAFAQTRPSFETPAIAGPQDEVGALCPKSSNSLVAHKLATLGLSDRVREGRLVLNADRSWRQIVLLRQLQNKARERILGLGRQTPDSLDSALEQLCHAKSIADTR
jgi:hypothetical protein